MRWKSRLQTYFECVGVFKRRDIVKNQFGTGVWGTYFKTNNVPKIIFIWKNLKYPGILELSQKYYFRTLANKMAKKYFEISKIFY